MTTEAYRNARKLRPMKSWSVYQRLSATNIADRSRQIRRMLMKKLLRSAMRFPSFWSVTSSSYLDKESVLLVFMAFLISFDLCKLLCHYFCMCNLCHYSSQFLYMCIRTRTLSSNLLILRFNLSISMPLRCAIATCSDLQIAKNEMYER